MVDLHSYIRDFLGELTEMAEISAGVTWARVPSDTSQKFLKPAIWFMRSKVVKGDWMQFTVAVTTSHRKITNKCKTWKMRGRMMSNCRWCRNAFGNGLQLKIRSQLKWNLSHVKMEYKHGSKHDRDQTRFVYQYNILSELHKSRCSLEEFPQKLQNSILSVFLKTHSWQGCTYHGCLVTGASIFHNEGPNICSINITIQKYVPVQTNRE